MRTFVSVSLFAVLAVCGCAGDSSSLMSVWNDGGFVSAAGGQGGAVGGQGGAVGGQGGAAGGQAGQVVISLGGSVGGGGGVPGRGSIVVAGGVRDLPTVQCTSASGGSCPVPVEILNCIQANCGGELVSCYYSDGVSAAAGGLCKDYAACMLASPCDGTKQKREEYCMSNFATTNPDCSGCMFKLYTCSVKFGCPIPTTCAVSAGGSHG
jgi:hypothetical protein